MGTVRGPVLGAALLYPLGEVLRGEFADQAGLHMVVFGLAIILIVLFAPSGLSGLIERLEDRIRRRSRRSEEHTSELQSLMRISYAVFCLKKKTHTCNTCTTAYIEDIRQTNKIRSQQQ